MKQRMYHSMLKDLNAMYAMGVPAESQIFLWAKLLTLTVRPPALLHHVVRIFHSFLKFFDQTNYKHFTFF